MGFYKSKSEDQRPKKQGTLQLLGVVVLSALVGSGATLAVSPILRGNATDSLATSSTSSASSVPATNVSVNVSDGITQAVKTAEPDVVAVENYTTSSSPFDEQSQTEESDIGSGVFFDKDSKYAYIVTNNHVVQGGTKAAVVLQSGKQVQAKVIGTDPYTDLAVLTVPIKNFKSVQPIQFANSDDIQAGDPAIAIGTPMGIDFADTVTSGIVSSPSRTMPVEEPTSDETLDYQSVIQTDAAINPGNSGGPLLNIKGQMIGINSSKIVEQDFEGMGFAIPSNEVEQIASELMRTGHATHPALGIEGYDMSEIPQGYLPNVPVDYGVYVQSATSSDAKSAGLKQGDVIIGFNGQTVQDMADLRTALFKTKPGDEAKLTIYRGSKKMTLTVKITEEQSPKTTGTNSSSSGSTGSNDGSGEDPFGSQDPSGGDGGGYFSFGGGDGGSYGSGGGSGAYGTGGPTA
ncbi:S1C family serine protease [Alicyclobacillus fodiniaquatilis]|uniref:S1C family serine protease n=1 Tax=Alicyclobacillus fodiniaquatilis TaxID=1661150 RepID=A0ABW4JNP3_9BACL